MSWSISVKTVGGQQPPTTSEPKNEKDSPAPRKNPVPSNFIVEVEPDECVSTLNDRIEALTGLKASQQRLIYRGRIINGGQQESERGPTDTTHDSNEKEQSKILIRDVEGLSDGQTIHLVPRLNTNATPDEEPSSNTASAFSSDAAGTSGSLPGSSAASLLATLLGLGMSGAFSTSDDDDAADETEARRQTRMDFSTLSRRNQRRQARDRLERVNAARRNVQGRGLTDGTSSSRWPSSWAVGSRNGSHPGSLEPVRQSLMTLHTMLHHMNPPSNSTGIASSSVHDDQFDNDMKSSPIDADRRWYRGQWLDCRDTVNQWLEATVVDIVRSQDILSKAELNTYDNNEASSPDGVRRQKRKRRVDPCTDPIIGANDLEGRKKLLLEPCEDHVDGEGDKEFRLRDNKDVQLLLIHYNGWPHRWDEWIRSDSERLRPFRTKTRHSPTAPYTSPTPQSVFQASPTTFMTNEGEDDREALLPELSRVVSSANELLARFVSQPDNPPSLVTSSSSLPWISEVTNTTGNVGMNERNADISNSRRKLNSLDREHLTTLAPLLDRLGRTLTDAAPHIAALVASLPSNEESATKEDNSEEKERPRQEEEEDGNIMAETLNLTSRRVNGEVNATTPLLTSVPAGISDDENELVDGSDNSEYADFVSGMVNVSRSEFTSRRDNVRNRQQENSNGSSTSSLLATYLTAAGLGGLGNGNSTNIVVDDDGGNGNAPPLARLLRGGGNGGDGGGGIDIHIHAIVTPAPGLAMMGPGMGGLGLTTLPTPATERARTEAASNISNQTTPSSSTSPMNLDDDELGLFSELYSETPSSADQTTTEDEQILTTNNDFDQSSIRREQSDYVNRNLASSNNANGVISTNNMNFQESRADSSYEEVADETLPPLVNPRADTTLGMNSLRSVMDSSLPFMSFSQRTQDIPTELRSSTSSISSGVRESRRVSAIGRLLRRALGRRNTISGPDGDSSSSPDSL